MKSQINKKLHFFREKKCVYKPFFIKKK